MLGVYAESGADSSSSESDSQEHGDYGFPPWSHRSNRRCHKKFPALTTTTTESTTTTEASTSSAGSTVTTEIPSTTSATISTEAPISTVAPTTNSAANASNSV